MDPSLPGMLLSITIMLGAVVGLAAFILWLKDQPGTVGLIVKTILGLIMLLFGAALLVWFAVLVIGGELDLQSMPRLFMRIGLPVSMLAIGWYWVRGVETGHEDQDIDYDSEELRESVQKARARLPQFIQQVRQHVDKPYIKFRFVTDHDIMEYLWGLVRDYGDGVFRVSLVNQPQTQEGEFEVQQDVPEDAVEDWQILHPDGRISGAYSTIASFQYLERTGVRLNRTMRKQKARFIDA